MGAGNLTEGTPVQGAEMLGPLFPSTNTALTLPSPQVPQPALEQVGLCQTSAPENTNSHHRLQSRRSDTPREPETQRVRTAPGTPQWAFKRDWPAPPRTHSLEGPHVERCPGPALPLLSHPSTTARPNPVGHLTLTSFPATHSVRPPPPLSPVSRCPLLGRVAF